MKRDLINEMKTVFALVFNVEEEFVHLKTSQGDVEGWDSLGHLRLMMAIEQRFGIKFTTKQITEISNIEDIVTILQKSVVAS